MLDARRLFPAWRMAAFNVLSYSWEESPRNEHALRWERGTTQPALQRLKDGTSRCCSSGDEIHLCRETACRSIVHSDRTQWGQPIEGNRELLTHMP